MSLFSVDDDDGNGNWTQDSGQSWSGGGRDWTDQGSGSGIGGQGGVGQFGGDSGSGIGTGSGGLGGSSMGVDPYHRPQTEGPLAGWSDHSLENLKKDIGLKDYGLFLQDRIGTYAANRMTPGDSPLEHKYDYEPTDYGLPKHLALPGAGRFGMFGADGTKAAGNQSVSSMGQDMTDAPSSWTETEPDPHDEHSYRRLVQAWDDYQAGNASGASWENPNQEQGEGWRNPNGGGQGYDWANPNTGNPTPQNQPWWMQGRNTGGPIYAGDGQGYDPGSNAPDPRSSMTPVGQKQLPDGSPAVPKQGPGSPGWPFNDGWDNTPAIGKEYKPPTQEIKDLIDYWGRYYGIPEKHFPLLYRIAQVESNYGTDRKTNLTGRDAQGIMQVTTSSLNEYNDFNDVIDKKDLRDPSTGIRLGVWTIRDKLNKLGSIQKALQGYGPPDMPSYPEQYNGYYEKYNDSWKKSTNGNVYVKRKSLMNEKEKYDLGINQRNGELLK